MKDERPQLFISYSGAERARVAALTTQIELDGSYVTWGAWRDLDDNDGDWREPVREALQESVALVAFVSAKYETSVHCREEDRWARLEGIPRLAVELEPGTGARESFEVVIDLTVDALGADIDAALRAIQRKI